MTDVREINKAIKAERYVYVVRNADPSARRIPIIRAKSEQGRLKVLTRYGTWQSVGGIYVVRCEGNNEQISNPNA